MSTGKNVQKWTRYFLLFFSDASERRVSLSAESKILASTFGRFRLYRLSTIFQFRNRNFLFRSGFNATYSTADRDCGATLTANANEQTLTYSHTAEPGNTQIYRCSWFISASSNTKMVDVKTTAMDMPGWLINKKT